MKWENLVLGVFVFCTLSLQYGEALTGRTCTVAKSRSQSYTAYQANRGSQKYYTKCGAFNWGRCTRYRDYYVRGSVRRHRTVYYADTICCPGWRVDSGGTHCGIHDQFPITTFCPTRKTVRATGTLSTVTWQRPIFQEPFDFALVVTSTYGTESATLPWGVTTIEYVATSQNNNKQRKCTFDVDVIPPLPTAFILGRADEESINIDEHAQLILECRAEYGLPAATLTWYRNGVSHHIGTSSTTEASDFRNYIHAVNTLTINPDRNDDGATFDCRTSPDVSKWSIILSVNYEVHPTFTFCPSDKNVASATRETLITWSPPIAVDPRYGEDVNITGNFGITPEKVFAWGVHTVEYTVTNRRNMLTADCYFTITLSPRSCNEYELPITNGALVCAYWPNTYTHICKSYCADTNDVNWFGRYPSWFICDIEGQWNPPPVNFNCSNDRTNLDTHRMSIDGHHSHYYAGSCDASHAGLRSNFIETIENSPYNEVCQNEGCGTTLQANIQCF